MIRQILTKANIFAGEGCGREKCEACCNFAKPQDCRRRGILYETTCLGCMVEGVPIARYVGESARSGAERMGEHMDDARSRNKDSHVWKHWANQHGGAETRFGFKILAFFSSPLERQVGEAVRIWRTGAEQILNSMSVYSRCEVPRIVAKDGREDTTLGDSEQLMEPDKREEPRNAREEKRQKKLDRLKDLLQWGKIDEESHISPTCCQHGNKKKFPNYVTG